MAEESRELETFLNGLPSGPIADKHKDRVLNLLSECWSTLDGSNETSMDTYKLGRAEDLEWNPPCLSFRIERHGGTVLGSSRAEMQRWIIDVEKGNVSWEPSGHRQLYPMSPRLDVKPIVASVIEAVQSGQSLPNGALIRDGDDLLRIKQSILIPDDGPKQTITGRRRRFRHALEDAMRAIGWELVAASPALKFKKAAP